MALNFLNLHSYSTKEIKVINSQLPEDNEELQVNISRKAHKNGDIWIYNLSVSLFKAQEIAVEEKTFCINYNIEGIFDFPDGTLSPQEAHQCATIMLFPYVRSGIHTLSGLMGLGPIDFPFIETSENSTD